MWILVWLSFIDGQLQYYQLGVYGTEAHCNKQKVKAEVKVNSVNTLYMTNQEKSL